MHEYGHLLGLGHSTAPSHNVVMAAPEYSGGYQSFSETVWWRLKRDDILGLRAIYGVQSGLGAPHISRSADQGITWQPVMHDFAWPSRYGYSVATDGDLLVAAFVGADGAMEGKLWTATSTDGVHWTLRTALIDTDIMRGANLFRHGNYWILLYLKETGEDGSRVKLKWSTDLSSWNDGGLELGGYWNVPSHGIQQPKRLLLPDCSVTHHERIGHLWIELLPGFRHEQPPAKRGQGKRHASCRLPAWG